MKAWTLILIAALLASGVAALAQQDEKQIQEAIQGLGSESFEEREKATGDLKKVGAPALPALKKAAADHQDPEVRARARRLVEELEKPPPKKDAPRRAAAAPSARVIIREGKGESVYSVNPGDGDPIEFRRGPDERVKLVYPDGQGGKAQAEAPSLEKFLADHKELAAKYGITKEGIDYAGTRLSFSSPLPMIMELQGIEVPEPPGLPRDPFGQDEEFRRAFEDLRRALDNVPGRGPFAWGFDFPVSGASLGSVPGVLRSQLSIPEGQGVVIEAVREGSTAVATGLKRHDVLLEIDGKKVTGPADVRALLKRGATLRILRAGKEETLKSAPPPKKEY